MKVLTVFTLLVSFLVSQDFFYNNGKKVFLNPTQTIHRAVDKENRYFRTQDNHTINITKQIILKLQVDTSIQEILDQYNLVLIKSYKNDIYLVEVSDVIHTLDIANKLYEDKRTIYAQPNFKIKANMR
ncbi:MAG: hypothetical protein U9N59_15695 [Campylobacterota bacterium]|nr:hypothetical protein [Campylobacterota bacterium]